MVCQELSTSHLNAIARESKGFSGSGLQFAQDLTSIPQLSNTSKRFLIPIFLCCTYTLKGDSMSHYWRKSRMKSITSFLLFLFFFITNGWWSFWNNRYFLIITCIVLKRFILISPFPLSDNKSFVTRLKPKSI